MHQNRKMPLKPGQVLDGKYRVLRPVGSGGMADVFEAENLLIRRQVAIKVLNAAGTRRKDLVVRFEREAQAAGQIGSDHIVEVLDLGRLPDGSPYMVMEYLAGETLSERIARLGQLTPAATRDLVVQVLDALQAAHAAGIVHRDLKPSNIFILHEKAGRPDFVKIIDFGVSKFQAGGGIEETTTTGEVLGSPNYMAPEQAEGSRSVDHRADLYAIGVILYKAVTGRAPFHAESFNEMLVKIVLGQPAPIREYTPDLDAVFEAIITRAMARDPEARFQSAGEFSYILERWPNVTAEEVLEPMNFVPPPPPGESTIVDPSQSRKDRKSSPSTSTIWSRSHAFAHTAATKSVVRPALVGIGAALLIAAGGAILLALMLRDDPAPLPTTASQTSASGELGSTGVAAHGAPVATAGTTASNGNVVQLDDLPSTAPTTTGGTPTPRYYPRPRKKPAATSGTPGPGPVDLPDNIDPKTPAPKPTGKPGVDFGY